MFCSNVRSENNSTSLISALINPCVADFANLTCFSVYIYVLILFLIYVRWSPNKHLGTSVSRRLFHNHNIRSCLILVLMLLHITEFGDYILSDARIWYTRLIPLSALISIIMCQIFYNKLEEYGNCYYLIVAIVYWLCCGCCRSLTFFTNVSLGLDIRHVRYATSLTTTAVCFYLAIHDFFTLFKEVQKQKSSGSVEMDKDMLCAYKHPFCNWYSKITFCWLTPILHLGYMTSLSPVHFGHIPEAERSSLHFNKLENMYLQTSNEKVVDLWKSFRKCYWKTFTIGGFLKLIGDITGFIPPLGISVVVRYIETIQSNQPSKTENEKLPYITWTKFLNNGYIMAVVVFVAILAQGTLSQNSTHIINVEGIRLKNALQGLIYRKLLRIRKNTVIEKNHCDNIGYITNLTTEDSYNIMSCFWIGNYIWAIPLKIILLIFLLHEEIGVSAVLGSIICIIVMLLLQLVIGKKMSVNYKIIADWSDKRLRRINEILQGIRFIKLCGWETDFIDEVSNLRKNELKRLNLDSIYWTNITFLANTSSIIIAVITLTLHHFIESKPIMLSSLFTSLALFNQLTVPLFIFPIMVPIVISATVSLKRIEMFLSLPEIKIPAQRANDTEDRRSQIKIDTGSKATESLRKCDETDDHSIRLRKITENSETEDDHKVKSSEKPLDSNEILNVSKLVCSWNDSSQLVLEIEDVTIHAGTLSIIIGEKGSGKTSFLSALFGEMICYSGQVEWKKFLKIGYVPQTCWLLNDTLRQNILFGCPFQEKHFSRVVQLCALKPDINSLPNKEHTVIGNRGVMLSGGQKQRIMIARMLYSRPDVIIMDDPFCSLDSKTTNYIFECTIKKFLAKQNKTVIMTTSCKKFLPHASQIIVMENCKLKAVGSYANVSKVASKEIQGLDEVTDERTVNHSSVYSDNVESSSHRSQKGSTFVPLKRCRSTISGSRYFTHDLLLPTDDCDVGPATLLHKQKRPRAATVTEYPHSSSFHRNVFRVSSLQTNPSQQHLKKKKRFELEDDVITRRHQSTVSDFGDDFEECSESIGDIFDEASSTWVVTEKSVQKTKSGFKIYITYIKYCGLFTVLMYFLLTFGWQIVRILTEFWLSYIVSSLNTPPFNEHQDVQWYMYSYVALSLAALVLSLFSTAAGQYAGSVSRKYLHKKMLNNIMKCSVQFFDNTSFGQIINRFSTDVEVIDKKISTSTQRLIQFQLLCMSAILLNCMITPWFIILVIPIALIYYMVQRFYRCSSRELQHLENILKTPIINHFSETFSGLEVIRALEQQKTFLKILFQRVDAHTNVFLISNSTNRWLGIMLDYLGGIIVFAAMLVSLISVAIKPALKTSTFFGLAINYTLLIPIYLTWVVKFLIDLEIYMGAVERIQRYSVLPTENYNIQAVVPKDWPSKGAIRFNNVTLRYSDQGRAVIQSLNLHISSGQKVLTPDDPSCMLTVNDCISDVIRRQRNLSSVLSKRTPFPRGNKKVGICGRTGSGKSSLMMSLFKMIPFMEGQITLDGVDIGAIPLQYLRSKISIVPQDVILFGGNIRQNLDLRHEFTDEELWNSLKLVRTDDVVSKIGGLDAQVQDGGSNLSAGEKQSICLARAILRDTCCLILDEATNSLTPEEEVDFLNMVLKIFQNRTIVVITHRVSSMLDFDRILVLDNGILVEDGSPRELLSIPNSKFFSLMRTAQELSGDKPRFYF